ncbi:MAG: D-aminoacyl-tRNA deacylase [Desulfurococcaceae archaeon]
MYGLVYSVKDPAGVGIASFLREYYGLDKCSFEIDSIDCFIHDDFILVGFIEDVIYFSFLDEKLPSSVSEYIVLSRHSSEQGIKSYTVHHTGNFGSADYGGRPGELGIANPVVSHKLLLNVKELCEEKNLIGVYEVSYEATHHGPTENSKPILFIEIGYSIEEWRDRRNHELIGLAIVDFIDKPVHFCKPVIGIGGGHYPRKHTELAFEENYCYGHIMAKHSLNYLTNRTLSKMIERSSVKPSFIIVEKKSTRVEHREIIQEFSRESGIEYIYI